MKFEILLVVVPFATYLADESLHPGVFGHVTSQSSRGGEAFAAVDTSISIDTEVLRLVVCMQVSCIPELTPAYPA